MAAPATIGQSRGSEKRNRSDGPCRRSLSKALQVVTPPASALSRASTRRCPPAPGRGCCAAARADLGWLVLLCPRGGGRTSPADARALPRGAGGCDAAPLSRGRGPLLPPRPAALAGAAAARRAEQRHPLFADLHRAGRCSARPCLRAQRHDALLDAAGGEPADRRRAAVVEQGGRRAARHCRHGGDDPAGSERGPRRTALRQARSHRRVDLLCLPPSLSRGNCAPCPRRSWRPVSSPHRRSSSRRWCSSSALAEPMR